jgi:hypothetical protein
MPSVELPEASPSPYQLWFRIDAVDPGYLRFLRGQTRVTNWIHTEQVRIRRAIGNLYTIVTNERQMYTAGHTAAEPPKTLSLTLPAT